MRGIRVVGVVALLIVLAAGCASKSGTASSPPAGIPKTIIDGQTLYYRGSQAFLPSVLDENHPNIVDISASDLGDDLNCNRTPMAYVQAETANSVTVLVAMYGAVDTSSGAPIMCNANAAAAIKLPVTLRAPLGHRQLLDAGADDNPVAVLNPARVAKLTSLPVGVHEASVHWGEEPATQTRDYDEEYGGLSLEQTTDLSKMNQHGSTVVRRFAVHGRPAVMTVGPGFQEDFLVQWQPDSHTLLRLSQASDWPVHHGLSADQLQSLAENVYWPG